MFFDFLYFPLVVLTLSFTIIFCNEIYQRSKLKNKLWILLGFSCVGWFLILLPMTLVYIWEENYFEPVHFDLDVVESTDILAQ